MLSELAPCRVEQRISRRLGSGVRLALVRQPLPARAALGRLLDSLGDPADALAIVFPHPRYSLTHTGGVAVAAAALDPASRGIGVDLELRSRIDPRAARLFLAEEERVSTELVRLWTVKEALFKADLRNAGRVLADYRLADARREAGVAFLARDEGMRFRYASVRLCEGWISVAAATGEGGS